MIFKYFLWWETKRERERERQTDRQTDRKTERQRQSQTDRQRDRDRMCVFVYEREGQELKMTRSEIGKARERESKSGGDRQILVRLAPRPKDTEINKERDTAQL